MFSHYIDFAPVILKALSLEFCALLMVNVTMYDVCMKPMYLLKISHVQLPSCTEAVRWEKLCQAQYC